MTLTEAGHRLLAHARRHEVESSTLIAGIRSVDATEHGSVTVACTEGLLIESSHGPWRRSIGLTRRSRSLWTWWGRTRPARRVVDARADVAVTFSLGRRTDVTVEHSVTVPICAVVALGHPLSDRASVDLAECLRLSPRAVDHRIESTRTVRRRNTSGGFSPHVGLQCERLAPILEFAGSERRRRRSRWRPGGDRKSGLTYIPLVHPVFAQRRAEIHTMRGKRTGVEARIVALIDALTDILEAAG